MNPSNPKNPGNPKKSGGPSAVRRLFAAGLMALAGLALLAGLAGCAGAGDAAPPATATPETAPPPVDTPVGLVVHEPGAMDGYALFNNRQDTVVYLVDHRGRLAHSWQFPPGSENIRARLLENGNLLATLRPEGEAQRLMVEMAPDGRRVWQYAYPGQNEDFLKLPNGNVLLLARTVKSNWEAIAAGANPEFIGPPGLVFNHLVEVEPAGANGGKVVWRWSPWDHLVQDFDPAKPNYGAPAEHPERIDLNYSLAALQREPSWKPRGFEFIIGLSYHPELNRILLSVRHFSELWIIDRSATTAEAAGTTGGNAGKGGDLLYRWGNPRAYGMDGADGQQLFFPHYAGWIPPGRPGAGNVLVFNKGDEFAGYERGYSSADELALPAEGGGYRREDGAPWPPAGPVWSYPGPEPGGWYSRDSAWLQRLPNGNTFITEPSHGALFQVTPAGEIVWRYVNPALADGSRLRQGDPMPVRKELGPPHRPADLWSNFLLEAHWYAPDYPGLVKLDLTPGPPLERPAR